MSTRRRAAAVVVIAASILGAAVPAAAGGRGRFAGPSCDDSWVAGASGSWSDGSNWSTGAQPTSSQSACITAAGTYTVTLTGSQSAGSLTLGGAGSGTQTLALEGSGAGSLLTLNGASTVDAGGVLALDSTASAASGLAGAGVLTIDGELQTLTGNGGFRQLREPITNDGTVELDAPTTVQDQSTAIINDGTWTVAATAAFTEAAGSFDNKGAIANDGSFAVGSGVSTGSFTQEGTGNTGNPIVLGPVQVPFTDSAGAGQFTVANVALSGTVPAGQLLAVQGVTNRPGQLAIAAAGAVNDGTITLDAIASNLSELLVGPGTLTNDGTLETVQDQGNYRYLQAPIVNNGTVEIGAAQTFQNASTATVNNGNWIIDPSGGFQESGGGSFDNQGAIANNGSFDVGTGVSGGTFTQDGTGNTGNPIVLGGGTQVPLSDSAGTGQFTIVNALLSGTVPAGQTLAVQGTTNLSGKLAIAAGGATSDGTITLDAIHSNLSELLAGPGTLTNDGTFETVQDQGNYRFLQASITNNGTVEIGAAQTLQDTSTQTVNNGTWIVDRDVRYSAQAGSWTQTATGTLAVTVDPANGEASGIVQGVVTSATSLAGTLQVTTLGQVSAASKYTVISEANAVSGTFATTDFIGPTYTTQYTAGSVAITDVDDTLAVGTTALPDGALQQPYSATLEPSGGTGPYTWSLQSGSLPAGLGLDSSTGAITGTPTGVSASFTVKVTDGESPAHTATQALTIAVAPQALEVTTSTLAGGQVGAGYDQKLGASGGTTPYSWSIKTGSLPAGLSLDSSTGAITGAPTGPAGTTDFTVEASDASSPAEHALHALSIQVAPSSLQVKTSSLSDGQVGVKYDQTLTATGGTGSDTWSLASGSLPAGLSLDPATGEITGTPTGSAGTASFTVQVTDSGSPAQTATQPLSITIAPATLQVATLQVKTTSLPDGQVGTAYSQTLSASGGTPAYTWSLAGGSLPAGLSLDPSSGEISGTPTWAAFPLLAPQVSTFVIKATDSASPAQTATQSLRLLVIPPPIPQLLVQFACAGMGGVPHCPVDGQVGVPYIGSLGATGGIQPYTWSVAAGALPAGLTLSPAGAISGTPTGPAGTATFTAQVSDVELPPQTATQQVSITIQPATLTVSTTSLPGGQVGSAYTATLVAAGGTTPYSWSLTTGALPKGLSLNAATGVISGTPTAAGRTQAAFTVSDSGTPSQHASTGSGGLSITIAASSSSGELTSCIVCSQTPPQPGPGGSVTVTTRPPGPGTLWVTLWTKAPHGSRPHLMLAARAARKRTTSIVLARRRIIAKKAGRLRFKLVPDKAGKALLRRLHKLRVNLRLVFTPRRTSGQPQNTSLKKVNRVVSTTLYLHPPKKRRSTKKHRNGGA